jgi:quercetin dioxygenase-like cupin family protein
MSVDLTQIELNEVFPGLHVAFPISSDTGTAATATVYFEVEPGAELPEHRDSAEELLVALEGSVEAYVGDTQIELAEGQVAVVPAMAPHGVRNTGDRRARILGFFGGSTVVSTFTTPQEPGGWQVGVIGAPMPMLAPLGEPVTLAV